MAKVIAAILLVLLVIYTAPFLVYGGASVIWGLRPPSTASPARFLLGVLVTKLGTAIAFVAIFAVDKTFWGPRWPLYALLWFVMFASSEVGDAISGRTTTLEAVLGSVSEAIYAPVSAYVAQWLLWRGSV